MMILVCSILILFATISDGYIINRSYMYDRYSIISYAKINKKIESDESKPSPEKNLFPKIGVGALVQLITMGAGKQVLLYITYIIFITF